MEPMFYTFPGDDLDTYGTIWTVSLDYLCFVPFAKTAAEACGIEVSPQTLERWLRFMACAQYFDGLIDDQPTAQRTKEARAIYTELTGGIVRPGNDYPDWIGRDILAVGMLFSNALAPLGGQRLATPANGVLVCAGQKPAATSVRQYSRILVQEGRFVGQLVGGCMSDEEQRASGFEQFVRWFGLFVAATSHCDALVDLLKDYERGISRIDPNNDNRKLLKRRLMAVGFRMSLHPKLCLTLVRIAAEVIPLPPKMRKLFSKRTGQQEETVRMWAAIKESSTRQV